MADDKSILLSCETKECPDTYFCTKRNLCAPCYTICTRCGKPKRTLICTTECPGFLERNYFNHTTAKPYAMTYNITTNSPIASEVKSTHSNSETNNVNYLPVFVTLSSFSLIAFMLIIIFLIVGLIWFCRWKKRAKLRKKRRKDVELGRKDSVSERASLIQYQSQSDHKLDDIQADNGVTKAIQLDDLAIRGKPFEDGSISQVSKDNNSLGINVRVKQKQTTNNQTAIPATLESFSLEPNIREHVGVISEQAETDLDAIPVQSSPQGPQPILVQADTHAIPSQSSRLTEVESRGIHCDLPPIPLHVSLLSNALTLNDGFTPDECTSSGSGTGPNVFVNNVGQVPLNDNAVRALDYNIAQPASTGVPHGQITQPACTVVPQVNNAQPASTETPHGNSSVRQPIEHEMDNTHSNTSNYRHADHIQQCTSGVAVAPTSTTTHALQDTGSIPQHAESTRQVVVTTGSDDETPKQTARTENLTERNLRSVTTDTAQDTDTVPKIHMPLLNSLGNVEIKNGSEKDLLNLDVNAGSNTNYPLVDDGSVPSHIKPTPNNKPRSMTPEPEQRDI